MKSRKKSVREIRHLHAQGLTYKQIGARLGLHESNVCRFMRGRGYSVRSRRVTKLARESVE
jgi:DNA-directed RNA polymerase specialized sigma subunit